MGRMAARVTDLVAHPLPPVLTPGPGSFNVFIGGLPAWRGIGAAGAAAIQAAKQVSDTTIKAAEAATLAAAGTPGAPVAKAAEETTKAAAAAAMGSMISGLAKVPSPSGGFPDTHLCATPLPLPPHGPGVVVDGSVTVSINGLPACRMGDTIIEAIGPPNKITMACPTVYIGDGGASGGSGGGAGPGGSTPAKPNAGGGGAPIPPAKKTKAETIAEAIEKIKNSDFGKTAEGKKVVAKLEQLQKDGKIEFSPMKSSTRGEWGDGKISVNDKYVGDVDSTASELVHEATHAVNEDDFPASKTKLTIDEEMRTNENQLDFYEEQRKGGFRDPELEQRRTDRANGKLRDNVRKRYPKAPEHL